jgi:hypothetical protein
MLHTKEIKFSLQNITIFLLLVLCFSTPALQASDKEQQLVLEVYPQWYSNDDYTLQGNIGIQKVFENDDWVTYYAKPSVSYGLDDNWGLHGGLGLYYTDYKENDNNVETRPYLGVSHFYTLTEKWKLSAYLRVEERFNDNKEDSTRLRLRLRTDYKMNPLSNKETWHKFTFGIEGFKSYYHDDKDADSHHNYDHESHVTLGLERSLSKMEKLRFELAWKYQAPVGEISSSDSNTVYFKIQYYPMWGKILFNRLSDHAVDQ